jgi:hypothetical protein
VWKKIGRKNVISEKEETGVSNARVSEESNDELEVVNCTRSF